MNINIVFKIASVGIIVAILCIILDHTDRKQMSRIVSLAGLIVALFMVVQLIADLMVKVRSVFELQ